MLQAGFPKREPNGARDLMDVQAVIVPGVGVAACQAGVDNTRENQMLVYNELKKGTPPAQIIEMLKKDPNIERRQFGILSMPRADAAEAAEAAAARNNRAGFNGSGNSQSSLFFGGQVGPDIFYQVQGNTLLGDTVMWQAAQAFTRATGTLADRVMAAMEAADANGGDHRCNCGANPMEFVPCDNKTAHVAYITIADKDRSSRRDPQRREVLRLHQRHQRRHQEGRERQPGQDAAHALQRVGEGGLAADGASRADPVQAEDDEYTRSP